MVNFLPHSVVIHSPAKNAKNRKGKKECRADCQINQSGIFEDRDQQKIKFHSLEVRRTCQ